MTKTGSPKQPGKGSNSRERSLKIAIIDLPANDEELIRQTAQLLVITFKEHWPLAYPDLDSAFEDIGESFAPERISRIAVNEQGSVVGWIAARPQYHTTGWELHPLAVHPQYQGQGIGRSLVTDLENELRKRGGVTLYLGSDDEDNRTSLGGRDLYPDLMQQIANIKNLKGHPYEFYQKMRFHDHRRHS